MPSRLPPSSRLVAVLTPLGGGVLGAALAGIVLIVLAWVTLDPCVNEPPIPLVMTGFLESAGALLTGTLVIVVEARARVVWAGAVVALVLVAGLWLGLLAHAGHAALDCTWKLYPPVHEGA